MEQNNGYFQISWIGKMAVCNIFAPKEGGAPVSYKELTSFLSRQHIKVNSEKELSDAVFSGVDCKVTLGEGDGLEFIESMDMICSLDKMKITCIFHAPSTKGNLLDESDIMHELKSKGVKFGIDEDLIKEFLDNHIYETEIVFAQGKPPVHGCDARIEYFFNTNPNLKPKHNEDGSVDYHSLDTISHVKAGDLLATLHPMNPGENGSDVFGKVTPPRSVKNKKLDYGRNITLSEDGLNIYSDVTGHVTLTGGKVFVSDIYDVPADVDNSTGDINYDGNVHVHGSVRGGFTVIAHGNIEVDGSVEDSLLQADGDIIVKCGIQGMQKGVVEAGGNVITKYIENAKVFAGGFVESGSIIYSEVSAGEDVIVAEKKGSINGGIVRASGKVEANFIGSEMGGKTTIEVGLSPEKKEKYNELQKQIMECNQNIQKLQPVIEKYDAVIAAGNQLEQKHMEYYKTIKAQLKMFQNKISSITEEFEVLHKEMLNSKHAKISVRRDIYPGTVVSISDLQCTVKDKRSFCILEKKNGEIVYNSL
ncbi:MAG: FapA family protein [Lachnospiraceae bacterium]|nr:FapA family protein [Lachnospiraceae bacterium]